MARIQVPDGMGPLQAADHHAPRVRAAHREMRAITLDGLSLSLPEIEVIRLRSAKAEGCETCFGYRIARDDPERAVRGAGRLTPRFYAAVVDSATAADPAAVAALTDRERVAYEMTDRTVADHFDLAEDEDFWTRATALFDDTALVELGMTIGSFSMSARFNRTFGLHGVCDVDRLGRDGAAVVRG